MQIIHSLLLLLLYSDHEKVVELLIEGGANVNDIDSIRKFSALHLAAKNGNLVVEKHTERSVVELDVNRIECNFHRIDILLQANISMYIEQVTSS